MIIIRSDKMRGTNVDIRELLELRDQMIEKARKAEAAANTRTGQIADNARRSLEQRNPKFHQVPADEQARRVRDVMLELRKTDAVWKGHVADNQWFIQQSIMYGTAVNGELLRRLVSLSTPEVDTWSRHNPAYRQS